MDDCTVLEDVPVLRLTSHRTDLKRALIMLPNDREFPMPEVQRVRDSIQCLVDRITAELQRRGKE
jgi:hypothetical protein